MKGFAHVDFATAEALQNATSLNGQDLDGRTLKVDPSTAKKGGSGGRGGFGRGGFGGGGFGRPRVQFDPIQNAQRKGNFIDQGQKNVTTFDESD